MHKLREEARELASAEVQYDHIWEHKREEERDRRFVVVKEGEGVFRVTGGQVERMVVQTDWENEEAITFLQHRMKRLGVDDALMRAGAVDGDEIRIVGGPSNTSRPSAMLTSTRNSTCRGVAR